MSKFFLSFAIFLIFISFSYATDVSVSNDYGFFYNLLVLVWSLLDILSMIWFVLPIIAWKLISNDFVYWTFMNMDIILWKIWNFSKNMANFLIGFILIFIIFKHFISLNTNSWNILKDYLPKIVIWGIAVNLSWFVIWVLISLSTILIIAFWSLPSSIANDVNKKIAEKQLTIPNSYSIEQWCSTWNYCLWWINIEKGKEEISISVRDILQYESNISGPLTYLLNSFIDITDIKTSYNNSVNMQKWTLTDKWLFLKLVMQLIILLLFLVPVIVLIIVALVRIFYLWIIIGFSPLIFLDNIFWGKILASKKSVFKFSQIIWLIFQPVLVVMAFSFWFLFLFWILGAINSTSWDNNKKVLNALWLKEADAWKIQSDYFQIQDTTQEMSKYIWWFFWYLFIISLLITVIWWIVKLSFRSADITTWIADSAFEFTESLAKSISFIPTPWWEQSVWSIWKALSEINAMPGRIKTKQYSELEKVFNTVIDIDSDKKQKYENIFKNLGKNSTFISENDKETLDEILSDLSKYSWKENLIYRNKNMQTVLSKLINTLPEQINDKNLRKIVNDIKIETDIEKQLKMILAKKWEIKAILLNQWTKWK